MEVIKKIFNPLYLIALAFVIFLFVYKSQLKTEQEQFFGFAENLEMEVNLDFPVQVNGILIQEGDSVDNATSLLDLTQLALSKDINDEQFKIAELDARFQTNKNIIQNEINLVNAEYQESLNEISAKIESLKNEIELHEDMKSGLKSIVLEEEDAKIKALRNEIALLTKSQEDLERINKTLVAGLSQKLNDESNNLKTSISRHNSDVSFNEKKLNKLSLRSPSKALVGNIHVKEGEYVDAFETMITLYEPNPTQVKGFVHEGMSINVQIGDEFKIRSFQDSGKFIEGKITGLGARIVEIPERLRRVPTMKLYGREVVLSIPDNNEFLQGEKVIISN
jgi:biotin carboxyl carrier protein